MLIGSDKNHEKITFFLEKIETSIATIFCSSRLKTTAVLLKSYLFCIRLRGQYYKKYIYWDCIYSRVLDWMYWTLVGFFSFLLPNSAGLWTFKKYNTCTRSTQLWNITLKHVNRWQYKKWHFPEYINSWESSYKS